MAASAQEKLDPTYVPDPGQPAKPETFPPSTLFVAVSDNDGVYAGEDGGPGRGGIGRWRVGRVGTWESSSPPNMAKRDPESGLIHSGWLEVVTQTVTTDTGVLKCVTSEKRYAPAPLRDRRTSAHARAIGFAEPVSPSPKAVKRAVAGKGAVLSGATAPMNERR